MVLQSFTFNDMEWSLWDRWILEGDLTVQQVLDWFKVRPLPCATSSAPGVHGAHLSEISSRHTPLCHGSKRTVRISESCNTAKKSHAQAVAMVYGHAQKRDLEAYSISCGQSLLYNNIFPKHKERLNRPMSELVKTVAKMDIPAKRSHFDVVVACEDDEGEDLDVPLVSIKFR